MSREVSRGNGQPQQSQTGGMDYLKTAELILVAHQRHRGGCLCGWSELGKSLPRHQVDMLREAGLLPKEPESTGK